MKKVFYYENQGITIELLSRGSYMLSHGGTKVRITDSSIWDWCDDESNPEKHEQAKREAWGYIQRAN